MMKHLSKNYEYVNDEREKVEYVLLLFLAEFEKILLMLIIFIFQNKVLDFLIICFALLFTRRFLGGLHLHTTTGCLFYSLINFELISYAGRNILIGEKGENITFILEILVMLGYAPILSENRLIFNKRDRIKQKIKGVLGVMGFVLLIKFIYTDICNMIVWVFISQIIEVLLLRVNYNLRTKQEVKED